MHDLELARENLYGELLDVGNEEAFELAEQVIASYERLWSELMHEEVFALDERFRLEERLRRLNELGFDAAEIEVLGTEDGYRLRLRSRVVESGHHRRRLLQLTGLRAQDNQARRLLDDVEVFRRSSRRRASRRSRRAHCGRWLNEVFEPAIASIPTELWASARRRSSTTSCSSTAGTSRSARARRRPRRGAAFVRRLPALAPRRAPRRVARRRLALAGWSLLLAR
jgi:hypothetical protein